MIIDTSYFQYKPLFIPNASEEQATGVNTPTQIEELQATIDRVEYQFLINALGYTQYTELIDQFEEDGSWKSDALQKWKDLVDGKDEWRGLRFTMGENKVSLIAFYVYYEFLYNDDSYYTTTGLTKAEHANAVNVNPTVSLVTIWNNFIQMYQQNYHCYHNYVPNVYFDWAYPYYSHGNNFVTMQKFMADDTEAYDSSFFRIYGTKNRFGL